MRARAASIAALLSTTASCWLSSSFGGLTQQPTASGDDGADAADAEAGVAADAAAPDGPPGEAASDAAACNSPTILEPTQNEDVGASIHLRVGAPPCIVSLACYLDSMSTPVATSQGDTLSQWVAIATMAPHHVNCNGWDGAGSVHRSDFVDFTRTY
jgi:hypothetical protein